ncbi:hypothetical protein LY474_17690 [Myxococcus stipitatus]|uniref:hypothetical protein n=1 Tax=Myxococcus stipitatus TaxID=83455 RepID=UPI001F3718FF|nr:hypothetical protein [Myxococcus stipitatus]MCE9669631.1 hypothetical protein [Myxococcus stipitatus]
MRAILCLSLLVLASACGGDGPPPTELVDAAKAHVERATAVTHLTRGALEALGLLPVYTCGEPRRAFLSTAASGVRVEHACVTTSVEPVDAVTDAVVLTFQGPGCELHGLRFAGRAVFAYRGGEDLMEVEADLRGLTVDGQALPATVGYGTCGDETRVWTKLEGDLPGHAGYTVRVDARLASRSGVPLLGGSTLILDGTGALTGPEGGSSLTFTALHYEPGEFLPKQGTAVLETADGHRVEAGFQPTLWRLGKVEVTVDAYEPVTVPILR